MVNQELISYVKDALARGTSVAKIKQNLLAKGWTDADISSVMSAANAKSAASPRKSSPGAEPPKKIWLVLGISALVIVIAIIIAVFFIFGGDDDEEVTCLDLDGYICYSDETCDYTWLNADDSSRCCPYECIPSSTCTEAWNCGNWTECENNSRIRNCTDANDCETYYYRPDLTEICGTQNQTNETCEEGDGCLLSCADEGGDPDCACIAYNVTFGNVTVCDIGDVCNSTIFDSSDSGICCSQDECLTPECNSHGSGDGFCVENCDQGDEDCTCSAQGGELSDESCVEGEAIYASDETPGENFCCKVFASCDDGDGCQLGCAGGDEDCTCEAQGGEFYETIDECDSIESFLQASDNSAGHICCKEPGNVG